MKIGTTKLIAENIAPFKAKNLAIFNGSEKVGTVNIAKMKPSLGTKLYSFGLVSDLHMDGNGGTTAYLDEAMTFFENEGCAFCCHAGDITNSGFYLDDTAATYSTAQMADYKSVIDAHPNLPMHGICGNHESYKKSITVNLAELKTYTGRELCYTLSSQPSTVGEEGVEYPNHHLSVVGDDVFIFIGQPWGTGAAYKDVWTDEFQWLYETLEANRNKRCFVFEHLTLSDDSGDPNNIHNAYLLEFESTLVGIMQHYKNAMLFHGHSHLYFTEQYNWYYANYSTKKGFKSIHIPSSQGSRVTVDGAIERVNRTELRSGYMAEVYENAVALKGYNFHEEAFVPIALYCIDTTLQTVEANTFIDSTGKITT